MATGNGAPLLNGGSSIDSPHAGATAEGARPPPTPAEEAAAASSSTGQIPRLSRTRLIPTEAEEADTTLQLGEFTAVPTLSHSEVKFLLDAVMAQRKSEAGGGKVGQTETLTKTMDYLKVFARFNTRESIMAVERVLGGYEGRFESFERSQLATLCPTDGDEAFTLIPSLRPKFSDAEMDEITKQITNLKTFENGLQTETPHFRHMRHFLQSYDLVTVLEDGVKEPYWTEWERWLKRLDLHKGLGESEANFVAAGDLSVCAL